MPTKHARAVAYRREDRGALFGHAVSPRGGGACARSGVDLC
jgi:hypothetical protein